MDFEKSSTVDCDVLFNKLRSDIIYRKDKVRWIYHLVHTYIYGQFGSKPFSGSVYHNDVLSPYGMGNTRNNNRLVEKWDTAGTTIAQQTASRFRQSLLPTGLDSIVVTVKGYDDQGVSNALSALLLEEWPDGALTEIDNAVADFLNFGTAIMTCKARHLSINQVSYYELLNAAGEYARAYLLNYDTFHWDTSRDNSMQERDEPQILKIDKDFLSELAFRRELGVTQQYEGVEEIKDKSGIYYLNSSDGKWKEYPRHYAYEELFVATMGHEINGYGNGCGVNALGPIIKANFVLGTDYLNILRTIDPAWFAKYGVKIMTENGEGIPNTAPGGFNIVSLDNNTILTASTPLESMLHRDVQAQLELGAFLPLREQYLKELDAAYNSYLFKANEPIPQSTVNGSATGAVIQLQDSINAYKAKSDAFMESILMPLCGFLLKNAIVKAGTRIDKGMPVAPETVEALGILNDQRISILNPNNFKIKIKDFAHAQSRRSDAMEIQEELGLTNSALQMQEASQEVTEKALRKIKKIYN